MKKTIALILACALIVPNLTACASGDFGGIVGDMGSQVYDMIENHEEIESIVADIIENELGDIAMPDTETAAEKETEAETEAPTAAEAEETAAETETEARAETAEEKQEETEVTVSTVSEATASEATASEATVSEATVSEQETMDEAAGTVKNRKLKFILEFYDDGSIEVKMAPEAGQEDQED